MWSRVFTGNYHSAVMYECDICFRRFGYKNVRDRHHGNHFYANNTIKESALIVHKMALEKHGRVENLSPSLLCGASAAVNAGKAESDTKEAVKAEETLVGRLLDWENEERGGERGEGDAGSALSNVDCDSAEKQFLGNDVKEHLQEVDGEGDLKTSTSEQNMEHAASSASGGGLTGRTHVTARLVNSAVKCFCSNSERESCLNIVSCS